MKVALFGKVYADNQRGYLQLLINELIKRNSEISIYEPYYKAIASAVDFGPNISFFKTNKDIKKNADILFSIGGDGTILDTVSIVRDSGIPILGINLGRLGFLSSISKNDIADAVNNVFKGDYSIDKRSLLQLVQPKRLFGEINYALNDLTIYRNNTTALIVVHVFVDDTFLNSYWGDGLIVSTPTGSTAYSLSVGGPIVTPGSKNFIVAPIASHNLTVRPIILEDSSVIKIKIEGREEKYLMTMDSRHSAISKDDEIIIKRCKFSVNLIQMNNQNFYSTIRDKLHWGVDYRN
ncbi:MAG: NAD kinase [Bacteroidetes bacterium]|nr:NAD kinase [Bacteroidota bacterium]MBL6943570.1 NAD kinase [Bacteroidales bacterium]